MRVETLAVNTPAQSYCSSPVALVNLDSAILFGHMLSSTMFIYVLHVHGAAYVQTVDSIPSYNFIIVTRKIRVTKRQLLKEGLKTATYRDKQTEWKEGSRYIIGWTLFINVTSFVNSLLFPGRSPGGPRDLCIY